MPEQEIHLWFTSMRADMILDCLGDLSELENLAYDLDNAQWFSEGFQVNVYYEYDEEEGPLSDEIIADILRPYEGVQQIYEASEVTPCKPA